MTLNYNQNLTNFFIYLSIEEVKSIVICHLSVMSCFVILTLANDVV